MKSLSVFSTLALTALLAGCVTAPQPLYSWNGYQTQVYSYLKSDTPAAEEQILALEKGVQQAAHRCLPVTKHIWDCCI